MTLFPCVQVLRHSEVIVHAGDKPWHCPHDTGFACMQNERVVRLQGGQSMEIAKESLEKASSVWHF